MEKIKDEKTIRQEQRFSSKMSRTSGKYLRKMEELSGGLESMGPFFRKLEDVYCGQKSIVSSPDKKVIGTYCVMAPPELIYAAGAQPVKLCSGSYTAFSAGEDTAPRDACPLVKAVEGFVSVGTMPLYEECEMMIVPVTCDCKKKMASMLKKRCRVKTLHVPAGREDDDMEMFVDELYGMIDELEKVTGNEITCSSLINGIRKQAYARYELSRFIALRKSMPYAIRGTHVMAMMNASSYMEAYEWGKALLKVNKQLEQMKRRNVRFTKKQLPRIMITGSPVIFPNIKIPLMIEEMGGYLAADETCMGERGMYDPVVMTDTSFDGMIRALANRCIRPCSCPTFADNRERVYRIRQMIKDYDIQGVVYHVLRGCLVYDFEYKMLEEELAGYGIPLIRLESDYNEEDVEQLRIRIEAFIEVIRMKEKPLI